MMLFEIPLVNTYTRCINNVVIKKTLTPRWDEASKIIYTHAGLPLSREYGFLSSDQQAKIREYVEQLSAIERTAYMVAYEHLGTSFHILHSNGFIRWSKEHLP